MIEPKRQKPEPPDPDQLARLAKYNPQAARDRIDAYEKAEMDYILSLPATALTPEQLRKIASAFIAWDRGGRCE